jgi:hypothetical protein
MILGGGTHFLLNLSVSQTFVALVSVVSTAALARKHDRSGEQISHHTDMLHMIESIAVCNHKVFGWYVY